MRTAAEAEHWLHEAEGVIAKEAAAPYLPGERVGMVKVKRVRTIDAVVMGWRPGKAERTVGRAHPRPLRRRRTPARGRPLQRLHRQGEARARRTSSRRTRPASAAAARPAAGRQGRDLEWIALRPELVVEITFDHVSDGRIRHGAKVQRWREDKAPEACTVDQLDQ